ncbi:hypothetical protein B0H14DRAFT_1193746 [Mycena olivaceomarginata]|nr:hypothetical protein B0H14DRAFT_1193746 [Mycena olivaceomarginata]
MPNTVFDSGWDAMMAFIPLMAVSLTLYGFYVCLFLLSLHTLSRRRSTRTILLTVASCTIAVVGSIQIAIDVALVVVAARVLQRIVHSEILAERSLRILPVFGSTLPALLKAQTFAFGINYFITDSIFLYRCYAIWGFQKKPIILPVLLMLSSSISGIILYSTTNTMNSSLPFILAAATNLVLTALTAGRILWIQRAASHVALDSAVRSCYSRAIMIILESGAVYCTVAIFLVISRSLNEEIFGIGLGIAQQVMNIIPTLTLVYIGLKNLEEHQPADLERGYELPPSQVHLRTWSRTRSGCTYVQAGQ